MLAYWLVQQPEPNRNRLAIGGLAKEERVEVAVQRLAELDGRTKAEVLALRIEAVHRYPQLLEGEYRPSEAVFGQIEDGLPWWGVAGAYYHGSGPQSIAGPAEQSLSILNPYLLAVPELNLRWDEAAAAEAQRSNPDLARYCAPHQLRWQPRAARAEVTYQAACLRQNGVTAFSLIAYNARDLNLSYIFVSYADSQNISKPAPPGAAYRNPQYLHRGGSCGYPGGCNNVSPQTPDIDHLQIDGWPAEVVIWFWARSPGSVNTPPDMVFVIHFN